MIKLKNRIINQMQVFSVTIAAKTGMKMAKIGCNHFYI